MSATHAPFVTSPLGKSIKALPPTNPSVSDKRLPFQCFIRAVLGISELSALLHPRSKSPLDSLFETMHAAYSTTLVIPLAENVPYGSTLFPIGDI